MAGFSFKELAKCIRCSGGAIVALFASQCLAYAQLSSNGNFVVPLSDPQVSLSGPVLTNGQVQLSINGEPGISYVIESSPDFVNWSPIATNSDSSASRTIIVDADAAHYYRASRTPLPLAVFSLATRGNLILNGNGQTTDSFNSADPAFSTDGQYDKTKRGANGTLASAQGIINIGSHVIGGNVMLGQSAQYTSATNQVLGVICTNQTLAFPEVMLPHVPWLAAPLTTSGYHFTTDGYYFVIGNSNLIVEAGVTVVLNVTTKPTFQSIVKIHGGATNSGTAYIFLNGCTNAFLYRNFADDASYRAKNLCYFGLPSLQSFATGDSITNILCVIYAPSANANINGGGLSDNFIGSMTAGSMLVNGHYQFHFDEDLLTNGPSR
jgi:hypothetical protein